MKPKTNFLEYGNILVNLRIHKDTQSIDLFMLPCSHQNQSQLEELCLERNILPCICSFLATIDALPSIIHMQSVSSIMVQSKRELPKQKHNDIQVSPKS